MGAGLEDLVLCQRVGAAELALARRKLQCMCMRQVAANKLLFQLYLTWLSFSSKQDGTSFNTLSMKALMMNLVIERRKMGDKFIEGK